MLQGLGSGEGGLGSASFAQSGNASRHGRQARTGRASFLAMARLYYRRSWRTRMYSS